MKIEYFSPKELEKIKIDIYQATKEYRHKYEYLYPNILYLSAQLYDDLFEECYRNIPLIDMASYKNVFSDLQFMGIKCKRCEFQDKLFEIDYVNRNSNYEMLLNNGRMDNLAKFLAKSCQLWPNNPTVDDILTWLQAEYVENS